MENADFNKNFQKGFSEVMNLTNPITEQQALDQYVCAALNALALRDMYSQRRDVLVKEAFALADAMFKERKKRLRKLQKK